MALIRGVVQVSLAMVLAASLFAWGLALMLVAGRRTSNWTPLIAIGALTVLYGLAAIAVGSVMGRRQGRQGLVCAVLGTLLTWGLLEFISYHQHVSFVELRAPLLLAVPLAAIGGIAGMSRAQDRRARARELEEEPTPTAAEEDGE